MCPAKNPENIGLEDRNDSNSGETSDNGNNINGITGNNRTTYTNNNNNPRPTVMVDRHAPVEVSLLYNIMREDGEPSAIPSLLKMLASNAANTEHAILIVQLGGIPKMIQLLQRASSSSRHHPLSLYAEGAMGVLVNLVHPPLHPPNVAQEHVRIMMDERLGLMDACVAAVRLEERNEKAQIAFCLLMGNLATYGQPKRDDRVLPLLAKAMKQFPHSVLLQVQTADAIMALVSHEYFHPAESLFYKERMNAKIIQTITASMKRHSNNSAMQLGGM